MSTTVISPRGRRTRDSLLVAGREVFERDGFLGARVTDIAAAAGVAHGTFYTYFATKEEIFREVAAALLPDIATTDRVYQYSGQSDLLRAISSGNRRYLETYRENARLMAVVEQVATFDEEVSKVLARRSEAYLSRAKGQIAALQEANIVDAEIDPYITALALTSMVSRYAHVIYVGGRASNPSIDIDSSVRTLTFIWANGLGLKVSPSDLEKL